MSYDARTGQDLPQSHWNNLGADYQEAEDCAKLLTRETSLPAHVEMHREHSGQDIHPVVVVKYTEGEFYSYYYLELDQVAAYVEGFKAGHR